ncbi:MAG: hypothetical protein V3V76_08530 [Candidatus Adiutricales bacterium]
MSGDAGVEKEFPEFKSFSSSGSRISSKNPYIGRSLLGLFD